MLREFGVLQSVIDSIPDESCMIITPEDDQVMTMDNFVETDSRWTQGAATIYATSLTHLDMEQLCNLRPVLREDNAMSWGTASG